MAFYTNGKGNPLDDAQGTAWFHGPLVHRIISSAVLFGNSTSPGAMRLRGRAPR